MSVQVVIAAALFFHGYPCTDDCAGHRAGYVWAQKKALTRVSDCPARSRSFLEGCTAWVEDLDGQHEAKHLKEPDPTPPES